ncbi:MAG: hypothetical protein LQ350_002889 [Teloschistes chrysophthalmus]|nr:MAG: hypothetical protein LQ350_002889 [Niorma chrysophthalma]
MSSGFVSGGTTDHPIDRDDEWLKAQQDIEAARRRKEEEGKQEGGKSLYEVLQNNKAAKQEAFEESIRLRNQFRNLDEDEVEFLDSVLESTRAKEAAVKKETSEQLRLFRRQQEEADKELVDDTTTGNIVSPGAGSPTLNTESQWAINARKRKRTKDTEILPGLKLRKASSTSETSPVDLHKTPDTPLGKKDSVPHPPPSSKKDTGVISPASQGSAVKGTERLQSPCSTGSKVGTLGLAAYSSDEQD